MTDSVSGPRHSGTIRAPWIVPVGASAIRDAALVVEDGIVTWMGRARALTDAHRTLPTIEIDGIVTPGLVNAHTHLQYTGFVGVGRGAYDSFEHWSEAFEVAYEAVTDPMHWRAAALDGAAALVRSGTTHVADVVTDDEARGAAAAAGLGGIEYLEAIGLTEARWRDGGAEAFVAWLDAPAHGMTVGVSPHAPYSLDGEVVRALVALARTRGMRVHSHVAESSVEAALYATGDTAVLTIYGGIRTEFDLARRGGAGCSTGEYARRVDLLGRDAHIAHGIYLGREERDIVRDSGTSVSLCPRSNAVIGLDAAPVAAYLREGHAVSVGTDSLGSAPTLDLLDDVRALARIARGQGYRDADLHERLLHAATAGGAYAMGLPSAGTLVEGGPATLAAFAVDGGDDPVRAIVEHGGGACVLTMAEGRMLLEPRAG